MANHCIDLLCLNCGASWCCRCGDTYSAKSATDLAARRLRFEIAQSSETKVTDACPECRQQEVVLE